jgi:hypothetical protein
MSWIFGEAKPSNHDIMMAMFDAQGKTIEGLVEEVKQLSVLVHSLLKTDKTDKTDKSVQVEMPIPLHQKNITDIDDIFHMDLQEFVRGCCITEESDDDTDDNTEKVD